MKIATAHAIVNADKRKVFRYVDMLLSGKKKYEFDTHNGFTFTKGSLDKPGSLFYTVEKFIGVFMKFEFMVAEYRKNRVTFRLLRPFGIYNIFASFEAINSGKKTRISLRISTKTENMFSKIMMILFYPVYAPLVMRQIKREVWFIKREINAI